MSITRRNQLSSATRSGTLTVAGATHGPASSVTVNGNTADRYADSSFARAGFSLSDGNNMFTTIGTETGGRGATNALTVNLPATVNYVYDLNGNLRTNGTRALEYDDENQLTRVTEAGVWKAEFVYDGKMRMRISREYEWRNSAWVLSRETRRVYDGNLVIQERNEWNVPQVTYTRGKDLSGGFEGAGGIGGLLARTEASATGNASHAYYGYDGNGNVTCLVDTNQTVVARYLYDPFGNTLAASGPAAEANLYRFSSKELHAASGLVYYLYRFYDPGIQRWPNRDPIHERGGLNLYRFVRNSPSSLVDPKGLQNAGEGMPGGIPADWVTWHDISQFIQNITPLGGRCKNTSGGTEWALVDGAWVSLAPGRSTGAFEDCDGMTCGGGFYAVFQRNAECATPGCDSPPYTNRRWEPNGGGDPGGRPPRRCWRTWIEPRQYPARLQLRSTASLCMSQPTCGSQSHKVRGTCNESIS